MRTFYATPSHLILLTSLTSYLIIEVCSVKRVTEPNQAAYKHCFWQLLMAEVLLHHVVRQAKERAISEGMIHKAKAA